MNVPCKDCPNRSIGCHSYCEKYKAFRKAKEEEYKTKKEISRSNYHFDWRGK